MLTGLPILLRCPFPRTDVRWMCGGALGCSVKPVPLVPIDGYAWISTKSRPNGRFAPQRISFLCLDEDIPPSLNDLLSALQPLLDQHGKWDGLVPVMCTKKPTQKGNAVNLKSVEGIHWCELSPGWAPGTGRPSGSPWHEVWRPSTQDNPLYLAFRCPRCPQGTVKVLSPSQLGPDDQRCKDCGKKARGGAKGKKRKADVDVGGAEASSPAGAFHPDTVPLPALGRCCP